MSRSKKTGWKRYSGYLLLVALYLVWFRIEGVNPWVLAAVSGLTVLYGLFLAPVPCYAVNRDNTLCRDNAQGLLRGCWRQQHKWQNAKLLVQRQSWARLAANIFRSIGGNAAALTVILGFLGLGASFITPFLNKGA